MVTILDLSRRRWHLQGWRPFYWELRRSTETRSIFRPEFGPYPTLVPGSVHTALRNAGEIKDWNLGRASLSCEWVEHRQWEFFTIFRAREVPLDSPIVLHADGLDYSGWIRVDDQTVSTFRGALIRHQFDLSKVLGDGRKHKLSILFDLPPEEQGQIGRSSLSRFFKPRYNYSWDWCVRLVPIGIWDRVRLVCGKCPIEIIGVTTATSPDLKSAEVIVRVRNSGKSKARLELVLRSGKGSRLERLVETVDAGDHTVRLPVRRPRLWWPNGYGKSYLYDFAIRDASRDRNAEPLFQSRIGFKRVRWLPCKDAPRGARPLLCEVNGCPIFLQGVNWTPTDLDYSSTAASRYEGRIRLYREMGCNMLRVWGGAFLEREIFYNLCDEEGLLVWQEFPLSSSGVDNDAPRDKHAIGDLKKIATDYIRRRGHHVSIFLWCGGNELQDAPKEKGGPTKPQDERHPAFATLRRVVQKENPGIRFLPTSPSGPIFYAERKSMGMGLHHHVHGPWDIHSSEAKWKDYWAHDDSLLRSETGVVGASSLPVLKKYVDDEKIWPPNFENPWWRHGCAWFVQWDLFKRELLRAPVADRLALFVKLSQERQARFLSIAAKSCKERFPKHSGFIIWMGHDSFPTPSNLSIIDMDGKPKAAYYALQQIFRATVPTPTVK